MVTFFCVGRYQQRRAGEESPGALVVRRVVWQGKPRPQLHASATPSVHGAGRIWSNINNTVFLLLADDDQSKFPLNKYSISFHHEVKRTCNIVVFF